MKKIKKIIKNNIVGFIIGVIIAVTISAYAATTLQSSAVYYDNSKSGGLSNTVSGAIDELYSKLNGAIVIKSQFKVGDYVKMTPTKTSFTIPATLTGYSTDQAINPSELNLWRVIRVSSDGTVEMVSEYVSSIAVYLSGKIGYASLVGTLNAIAHQYENANYTVGSRHMGFNGQTGYIIDLSKIGQTQGAPWQSTASDNANEALGGGDTLEKIDVNLVTKAIGSLIANKAGTTTATRYWVASRYYYFNGTSGWYYYGHTIETTGVEGNELLVNVSNGVCTEVTYSNLRVRPIIILKSGIKASSGNGTSASPYVLN